jgi:mismatch-specific thymine-DNA glycosylase
MKKETSSVTIGRAHNRASPVVKQEDEQHDSAQRSLPEDGASIEKSSFGQKLQQFSYVQAPTSARRSCRLLKSPAKIETPSGTRAIKHKLDDRPPSTPPSKRLSKSLTSPRPAVVKTASPSPIKQGSSRYAAPTRYEHLKPLVDILEDNLLLVFIGVNPGVKTAVTGHAYAHPSNRFWHLLHTSGLTPERKLSHTEDRSLPRLYGYGSTNIVERPSKDQSELSREEMIAGTARLDEKFLRHKPEAVCIVGKGIWEAIWRYRYGRNIKKEEFHYGWQDEKENLGRCKVGGSDLDAAGHPWNGSKVFVATSTSGLAANLRPEEKLAIWLPLGEWTQQRRQERIANGISIKPA